MRTSRIRARLINNQVVRIACLYYPTMSMPAHAAHAHFDALWLDAEHNAWERREIQRMVALHHLANIDCMVRTGSRNPTDLYRLLEDGASALLIPFVNSRQEAEALVKATKFPPVGQRGVDGAGLDNSFALHGRDYGYFDIANRETLLIVQIETPEAIEVVDEIASVPGLDGIFIGPGDLALRLECPMDWAEPKMQKAQTRVAAAAAGHGIAWGRPARSAADIRSLAEAGARLIAHGSDFGAVAMGIPLYAKCFNEALGEAGRTHLIY
ncbi:MAG: hypothetical protein LBC18_01735 [Opitutaceae bacterium]|jgi:2-keto-3-deoxy-L-rhamnonate aldolase RhmA|nr:hypothetical protein [Opitutaceae bacterium]